MNKPLLKWLGGKTQIMDEIISRFPKRINTYIEPFVGGGSVLLALLSSDIECKKYIASDVNTNLINFYKVVRSVKGRAKMISICGRLFDEYNSREVMKGENSKEELYYEMRDEFNSNPDWRCSIKERIIRAALFLFLNKTCFRGVYRENKVGTFNTPFGNYKSITLPDINKIGELIKRVKFIECDFDEYNYEELTEEDFVYCDPPYVGELKNSFTNYNANGFREDTQLLLFETLKLAPAKFMMSNSHMDLVMENFTEECFHIDVISARRAIHSKNPAKKTNEVIIRNYN